jgi:hypothetical protein
MKLLGRKVLSPSIIVMSTFLVLAILIILVGVCGCIWLHKHSTEHLSATPEMMITPNVTNDIRYWPYYYYTLPYRYQEGGAFPPNMYTRFAHWQPGYDVHGWSFDMRPGMGYDRWRRNVWVKQNGSKYFINNGTREDRPYDYWGVR